MQKLSKKIRKAVAKAKYIKISFNEHTSLIANQAINFEKEAIFVAIPKTGTTTVRGQISPKGIPIIENPHLNILQIRDLIYIHLLRETLGTNRAFPKGNIESDAALRLRANEVFTSFFKFSAVRNPWARAVSLYFRREGIQLKDKLTFDEFCEDHIYASDTCRQPTLHQNQFDWLCSDEGKIIMDYVYKIEDFETAITDIQNMTNGRLVLKNEIRNRNPNSKSSDYKNLYNERSKKLIEKRFEKDIDYFKYTF